MTLLSTFMLTKKEQNFLHWMEDNHSSDMPGAVLRSLPVKQREIACRLVEADILNCAQSLQTGTEETVVRAYGDWVLNQYDRAKSPLPVNAEEVQITNCGNQHTHFVIQRMPR